MDKNVINSDEVKHIANLARIGISDLDADFYAKQMSSVLEYMNILDEVNTEDVEMTLQVNGLNNVMRSDDVLISESPVDLLEVSSLPKVSGQIAVKSVIHED